MFILQIAALLPMLQALDAVTNVEEAEATMAAKCHADGAVAAGSCDLAMLQHKVSNSGRTQPIQRPEVVSFAGESALSGERATLDNEGYRKVLTWKSKRQIANFMRRVLMEMQLKIVNEDYFRDYVGSLNDQQDLNSIRANLLELNSQPCSWVKTHDAVTNVNGATAPLTEDGFRAVVELRSPFESRRFASRIIEDEGYYLLEQGGLDGMLGWYSCEKGIQSLMRMRDEIRGVASSGTGWVSVARHLRLRAWHRSRCTMVGRRNLSKRL